MCVLKAWLVGVGWYRSVHLPDSRVVNHSDESVSVGSFLSTDVCLVGFLSEDFLSFLRFFFFSSCRRSHLTYLTLWWTMQDEGGSSKGLEPGVHQSALWLCTCTCTHTCTHLAPAARSRYQRYNTRVRRYLFKKGRAVQDWYRIGAIGVQQPGW